MDIPGKTSKRLRATKGSKEGMLDVSSQLSYLTRGWLYGRYDGDSSSLTRVSLSAKRKTKSIPCTPAIFELLLDPSLQA